MATTSHARCRRCGGARHKNVSRGMCERCWRTFEKPRLKAEKLALRARRDARRSPIEEAVEYVLKHPEETPIVTASKYTDEQKIEIGRLYEEGLSYAAIKEQTGATAQTVITAARALGLPVRQQRHNSPNGKAPTSPEPAPNWSSMAPPEEPSQDAPESTQDTILSMLAIEAAQQVWSVRYRVVTVVERTEQVFATDYMVAAESILGSIPGAEIIELKRE